MTTDQLSALLAQDPAAVLEHDRRLYEQQIVRAADLIAAHAQERPAVLLAGRTLRRRPGELVILEGIHALNPEVTGYDGRTTRIYVSVRTRITPRSGHPLHPSKIRLVRRMLRDSTGRGRALSETIAMRERVDRGEQNYIMPFKPRAHGSIDSFYSAELGVYRPLLRDELERLALPELSDVVEVMRELPDVPAALVPQDSLLREFIGGSTLPY